MKKYIVGAVFVLAALILSLELKQKNMNTKNIKLSIVGSLSEPIAPENISTIQLYHLHRNIWDSLIQGDKKPWVAKKFKVSADLLTYEFEIDENAKFSNGRSITADDVKFSIERIIKREESGHLNAKAIVKEISILNPSSLRLTLEKPTPSFLHLLSSPEMGIVPRESCDEAGNIKNLSITSGSYFIKELSIEKNIGIFQLNEFSINHRKGAPDLVEVHFVQDFEETKKNIADGNFPFFEVYNSDVGKVIGSLDHSRYAFSKTVPSLSNYLVINPKLLRADSAKELAKLFQRKFQYFSTQEVEFTSKQFLPPRTFGSLLDSEIPQFSGYLKKDAIPKSIVIKSIRKNGSLVEAITEMLKSEGISSRWIDVASKEEAHVEFTGQGMNLEYPELELHLALLSTWTYVDSAPKTKELLGAAIHEANDSKRSEMIKRISQDLLGEARIIPISVRSYVHIFEKNKVDASDLENYDGEILFEKLKVLE